MKVSIDVKRESFGANPKEFIREVRLKLDAETPDEAKLLQDPDFINDNIFMDGLLGIERYPKGSSMTLVFRQPVSAYK